MTIIALLDDVAVNSNRPATTPIAVGFAAAARAVANWRADRAREIALTDLLHMDPHRLNDLGISVHEVRDALAQARANRR